MTGGVGLKWVRPSGLDRSVDFGGAGLSFISRHSSPIDNPDDCYLKDMQYGIAPYDIVGVASMNWWHTTGPLAVDMVVRPHYSPSPAPDRREPLGRVMWQHPR